MGERRGGEKICGEKIEREKEVRWKEKSGWRRGEIMRTIREVKARGDKLK